MKTRIFTLLAAMLLTGISAFAQSVEPIKGDVNSDGRVDVADIANIIDIMAKGEAGYFYFGTVQPTAENYTSLPGVVGSYTSIAEASGAMATIAVGETLYMLCPASWMEGKTVEIEDEAGNPISFLEEKDVVTISGYVIYRTQVLNDEKNVVLKTEDTTKYFYVQIGGETLNASNAVNVFNNAGIDNTTVIGRNGLAEHTLYKTNKRIIITYNDYGLIPHHTGNVDSNHNYITIPDTSPTYYILPNITGKTWCMCDISGGNPMKLKEWVRNNYIELSNNHTLYIKSRHRDYDWAATGLLRPINNTELNLNN